MGVKNIQTAGKNGALHYLKKTKPDTSIEACVRPKIVMENHTHTPVYGSWKVTYPLTYGK